MRFRPGRPPEVRFERRDGSIPNRTSVTIEDLIAEGDKVVLRNKWTGTDVADGTKIQFSGIVIWRIAHRQLVERWAYLEKPHPAA